MTNISDEHSQGPPPSDHEESANPDTTDKTASTESGKTLDFSKHKMRTGVYHIPDTTTVRLVRPHRYKRGMFEVFEFNEAEIDEKTQKSIIQAGGWRDVGMQWYDLVQLTQTTRHEIYRRNPLQNRDCQWEGWERFGSKYVPLKQCEECSAKYRNADINRVVCSACSRKHWKVIQEEIDTLKDEIVHQNLVPKGSWQQLQTLRDKVDQAEKDEVCSRTKIKKLQDKLHAIYRALIEKRRKEQESYKHLVDDLHKKVASVLERSMKSEKPDRVIIDDLRRIRNQIRGIFDDKKLGIRDFRQFMDDLHKASKHEEDKFEAQKKERSEKLKRWETNEKTLSDSISAINIGTEFSQENWDSLQNLRNEIKNKKQSNEISAQGYKHLFQLIRHLSDQETNLKEIAKSAATGAQPTAQKAPSRKKTSELKKTLNKMNTGLGYSHKLWEELIALQRQIIQFKNDGTLTASDYQTLMTLVNDKLTILKKLRAWSE